MEYQTPLEKCQYFDFLDYLGFFSVERPFFGLQYCKAHFPGLYCLQKDGRMASFLPKPWTNLFLKKSLFRLF